MNNFKRKIFGSLGAVVLTLLFLTLVQSIFPRTFSFVENFRNFIGKNLHIVLFSSSTADRASSEVISENRRLREDLRRLTIDYVLLEKLKEENAELKNDLKLYDEKDKNITTAQIVGWQKIDNNKFILLNKGRNSGITPGLPVVVGDHFIIGIIAYSSAKTSYVALINESSVTLSAKILNAKDSVQGVVQGQADLSIVFDLIPKELDINEGDIVVTSGLDLGIPANLIIGRVESIKNEPNDFFKSAIIKPLALAEEYEYVNIINSFKQVKDLQDIPNL